MARAMIFLGGGFSEGILVSIRPLKRLAHERHPPYLVPPYLVHPRFQIPLSQHARKSGKFLGICRSQRGRLTPGVNVPRICARIGARTL
jgi:hypothetical protein